MSTSTVPDWRGGRNPVTVNNRVGGAGFTKFLAQRMEECGRFYDAIGLGKKKP
jgi:hypothetical protein